MSRSLLGVCLTFAAFLTAHLAGAGALGLVGLVWRRPGSPASRARRALALRLAPTASATLLALMTALAFALHEPANSGERPDPRLLAAALLGAWLLSSGAWRAVRALLLTRRLLREWRTGARPLSLPRIPAPVYRIEHAFPVVAAVGIFRPRLFLAGSVLDLLSPAELRAVLAHEWAHVEGRDNLKRWLVRSCPDLPILDRVSRRRGRDWEDAAEAAADERAARAGPGTAANLASALVKVGRLVPPGRRLSVLAVALHSGGDLRGRVGSLLSVRVRPPGPNPRATAPALFITAALLGLATASLPRALLVLHRLLEAIIQALA